MDIFVFGSNLAGRHGKGSAKEALLHHGAKYGVGVGRVGRSYAIPTKDHNLRVMPISEIERYVTEFLDHARNKPEDTFNVVRIGCGLAGYRDHMIAPLFADAPENVNLPDGWRELAS